MKLIRLIAFAYLCFSVHSLAGQSFKTEKSEHKSFFGSYRPYKWINEKITELTDKQANSLLKGRMQINPDMFILFDDSVRKPTYRKFTIEKHLFFSDYTIDDNLFRQLGDTLTILSVIKEDGDEDRRIIISGKSLIVNYMSFFFFFNRRDSLHKR